MAKIDIDSKYKYKNLNETSTVIDIGGFNGEWAFHIANKYNCTVHVFEPSFNYFKILSKKPLNNAINLYKKAVSDIDGKIKLYLVKRSEGNSIYDRSLSLPIYPGLTDGETDYIINNILQYAKSYV